MTEHQLSPSERERLTDVSAAAGEFYWNHLFGTDALGGWGDEYALIRELDDAGLIRTRLVYIDGATPPPQPKPGDEPGPVKALKPVEIRDVDDVLRWAFEYLGIEGLCDDGCGCDAGDFPCDEIRGACMTAKKEPYNPKRCQDCESENECESFGRPDVCYSSRIYRAPSAPSWSSDPPTEEGWYWVLYPKLAPPNDIYVPFIVDVWGSKDRLWARDHSGLSYPVNHDKGCQWLKIEVPAPPEEREVTP